MDTFVFHEEPFLVILKDTGKYTTSDENFLFQNEQMAELLWHTCSRHTCKPISREGLFLLVLCRLEVVAHQVGSSLQHPLNRRYHAQK